MATPPVRQYLSNNGVPFHYKNIIILFWHSSGLLLRLNTCSVHVSTGVVLLVGKCTLSVNWSLSLMWDEITWVMLVYWESVNIVAGYFFDVLYELYSLDAGVINDLKLLLFWLFTFVLWLLFQCSLFSLRFMATWSHSAHLLLRSSR